MTLTRRHHPLLGQTFEVLQAGPRQLLVRGLDGLATRLPRSWTDADGARSESGVAEEVFSVEAIRALLEMVEALSRRNVVDSSAATGACQGPEGGTQCPSKPASTCGDYVKTRMVHRFVHADGNGYTRTNDRDATRVVWLLQDTSLPNGRRGEAGQVYVIQ